MKIISCVSILIILVSCTHVYNQPVDLDENDTWKSGHHPFPEMSRFLNSDSRIHHHHHHHHLFSKSSISRTSYPLLEYICSVANNTKYIEEMLIIFGEKYRSTIKTIIKQDCPKRDKRTTININKRSFARILSHRL